MSEKFENPYADLLAEADEMENDDKTSKVDDFGYVPFVPKDFFQLNKMKQVRIVGPWVQYYNHRGIIQWVRRFNKDTKEFETVEQTLFNNPCLATKSKYTEKDACPLCHKHHIQKEDPSLPENKDPRRSMTKRWLMFDIKDKKWFKWDSKKAFDDVIFPMLKGVVDDDGTVLKKPDIDVIDFAKGRIFCIKKKPKANVPNPTDRDVEYEVTVTDVVSPIPEEERAAYEAYLTQIKSDSLQQFDYAQLNTLCFGTKEEADTLFKAKYGKDKDDATLEKVKNKKVNKKNSAVEITEDDIPF